MKLNPRLYGRVMFPQLVIYKSGGILFSKDKWLSIFFTRVKPNWPRSIAFVLRQGLKPDQKNQFGFLNVNYKIEKYV